MSVLRPERAALVAAVVFFVLSLAAAAAWKDSGLQVTDVSLYRTYGERIADGKLPYADFEVEYPPLALPIFVLPALLTDEAGAYRAVLAMLLGGIGAVGVLVLGAGLRLLHRSPSTRQAALAAVALSPLLLGALLLDRFDLVPVTLSAAAVVVLLSRRPVVAGAILGLAIAVKLYPGVLLPLVAGWAWHVHGRRPALRAVAACMAVPLLVYLPFVLLAPAEVAHSIGHQLSRPLQIESLGASLLLAAHHVAGVELEWGSGHGSQNLLGAVPVVVAGVTSALQVLVLGWLWWTATTRRLDPDTLVRLAAACVVAFAILGKVHSPQFVIWPLLLVPLVGGARLPVAGALYAAACALTLVWFPSRYWELVREFDPVASWALLGRNLVLVALLAVLAWPARRGTVRGAARGP